MICSNCGAENPTGLKFCEQCAAPFKKRCARCGFENSAAARFCGECAAPLSAATPGLTPQPETTPSVQLLPKEADAPALEGERKTVTALFADIKGSTELMRNLDPEEARALVDPALKLMIDAAHRYDGYVVQSTGDGIFALFGAPVAHEDHPQRALHAALAMRAAIRRSGEELKKQGRSGVEVRIGINTGEVVLRLIHTGGHTEYTPVGHVANLAARMQTAAPTAGIVISEDTRHLVEGYFELRELGPTEVKGIEEPINVYEVIGVGPLHGHFELAVRRGLTKFVGRESELKQMARALELARRGHGQIVAVVAEAGTGKSRLFYEFKATLPAESKVLEAYSVSHGKASAWLPVLELLYGYFGIEEADGKSERRTKIETRLSGLDSALSDTLPLLYTLMGLHEGADPNAQMDPQIKLRRTVEAIKRILLRESLNQPLVVIFEDLHWIDSQTQELLDLLTESIANARMLLLFNYRPEYRHQWTNKSYYAQLRLDTLSEEGAAAMLSALLGEGVELAPLKRLVIERTEGNPFFIEEMVQALFDEGALVRNGVARVARSLAQLRLPSTVQGILAARIDRLGAEQKELLQTMAVIGRESSVALIRQMASPSGGELEQMLSVLQAGEFIYEQPAAAEIEYIFKHALTQEVAYNSLLMERRKLLHERAAMRMESLYADRLDDHLSDLAHHYSRSDNDAKAIEYLGRAGRQAIQRSAHAAAINSLSTATDLLQRLPEGQARIRQELALQLDLGVCFMVVKQWSAPEVAQVYARARELCRLLGDPPQLFPVLFGLNGFHTLRGELNTARELSSELLAIVQGQHDTAALLNAHFAVGLVLYNQGEFLAAGTHFEHVRSLYKPALHQSAVIYGGHDPGVHSLGFQSLVLWRLGYPDQAADRIQAALNLARELSHPYSSVLAFNLGAICHLMRGEGEPAWQLADAAYSLSVEHGFQGVVAFDLAVRGWALVQRNKAEEGALQLREGLSTMRQQGMEAGRPWFLSALAGACAKLGQAEEGLGVIAEALQVANKTGEHSYVAELHRLSGELLLQRTSAQQRDLKIEQQAEACYRQAIEVARHQSDRSIELRATTSLARLLTKQGRRNEARTMLADIYGWFTEGFETADLKDAKALLDELAT